jgi:hypothetical protein
VLAPVGTEVRRGDAILRVRYADDARLARAQRALESAIEIAAEAPVPQPLLLDVITAPAPAPEARP